MGIKTFQGVACKQYRILSEKPPHHMGIKTSQHQHIACWFVL